MARSNVFTRGSMALASAAVAGTLGTMREMPMAKMVATIENVVRSALGEQQQIGVTLRGRGAIWALELSERVQMKDVLRDIHAGGLLVSSSGRYIRLLPAATIDPAELRQACDQIARYCASAYAPVARIQQTQ